MVVLDEVGIRPKPRYDILPELFTLPCLRFFTILPAGLTGRCRLQQLARHQISDDVALIPLSSTPDDPTTTSHRRTGENITRIWVLATLPLILHFATVLTLFAILTTFINGHDFNLTSRHALSKFTPLQSDVTTVISSGVTMYRFFATMWSAATLWRCIFILMAKGGVSLEQIDSLLTWQIHLRPRLESSRGFGLLISIILLAAFPSQLSGPILTGSVTWSPSHRLSEGQRFTGIDGGRPDLLHPQATYFFHSPDTLSILYKYGDNWASAMASTAWQGSLDDKRTMKRVIRALGHLPINSTLNNLTLPYFAVSNVEWVPMKELPAVVAFSFGNSSNRNPFLGNLGPGSFTLIPDDWDVVTVPSPYDGIISRTQIIVGAYSAALFGHLPSNASCYDPGGSFDPICLIHGRVTYVAGAAECRHCRVSSWITVQNDSALNVTSSFETLAAISMMPVVGGIMARLNTSLPTRTLDNIDGYIAELLIRSYAASWTFTRSFWNDGHFSSTDVQIPIPTSLATVSLWRVGLWLWLNLLFTGSGLLFLFTQRRSGERLVGSSSLAALLLDTSEVLHERHRAFCDFSTLIKDDEGIGYLRFKRESDTGGHKQVEIVERIQR